MNHVFESATVKQRVLVEYLTAAGSAFAVNANGEGVFINARIVDSIGVEVNKEYLAFLLPNYPDKREHTPWRAMRMEADVVEVVEKEVVDSDVLASLDQDPRAVTVGTLAEDLGIGPDLSSKLLTKLHASGKLAKIGLYLSTSSERASRAVYCRQQDSALLFDWLLDWQEDDNVET